LGLRPLEPPALRRLRLAQRDRGSAGPMMLWAGC
jgi:hypothetical protein